MIYIQLPKKFNWNISKGFADINRAIIYAYARARMYIMLDIENDTIVTLPQD